ncbi:F-box/LRR-repeat protein 13 [Linum grandiflorum]
MTDGGVDWISKLPDSILHHILFFLDTKSAVQTCVLSKQWESAWKHVHALNLSLYFDECSRYETFVNNFLSFRHPLHIWKLTLPILMSLVCSKGSSDMQFPMVLNISTYNPLLSSYPISIFSICKIPPLTLLEP